MMPKQGETRMRERLESFAEILVTSVLRGIGLAAGAYLFLRFAIAFDGGLW